MQLKNKAEREKFLENYKAWELFKEVPELELKFYRYEFPNGTVLIATEYADMKVVRYDGHKAIYEKGTDVRYHLILSEGDNFKNSCFIFDYKLYEPSGNSKSSIIEYLTKTKPEIEFQVKNQTHYGLIGNMSIDEIAELIYTANDNICFENCTKGTGNKYECPIKDDVTPDNCKNCIKKWLLSEVKE